MVKYMGEIKINNEIYGTSNSSDIVYKDTTVEEKLDAMPIYDIDSSKNIDNDVSDYLTYGHIINALNSDAENKVLSAKQGKVLNKNITTEISDRKASVEILNARMDTFTKLPSGSTAGDAELQDIRVGAGGEVYGSAGAAVRGQIGELKGDIKANKKAVEELADKKITKFYANNLGETTLHDSDNGKIADMMIFGKSVQDGEPTPDSPVEIQSVANPVVKVCGKNIYNLNRTIAASYNTEIEFVENGLRLYTTSNYKYCSSMLKIDKLGLKDGNTYTLSAYVKITKGSARITIRNRKNTIISEKIVPSDGFYTHTFKKTQDMSYISFFCTYDSSEDGDVTYTNIQLEKGSVATTYEPYTERTSTLPYTLNAIPVSVGGNITIDGQQYISDYVDVNNKQIVRNIFREQLGSNNLTTTAEIIGNNSRAWITVSKNISPNISAIEAVICDKLKRATNYSLDESYVIEHSYQGGEKEYPQGLVVKIPKSIAATNDEVKAWIVANNPIVYYVLETPIIEELTTEQAEVLSQLSTCFPITNVSVTSDQLDGYMTFNYQMSMANGWKIIKEQLGDTREYIYDMDLQSAEAYVNSEYAVALAELEV